MVFYIKYKLFLKINASLVKNCCITKEGNNKNKNKLISIKKKINQNCEENIFDN